MFGKNDSLKRIGLTIATAGLVNTSESYIISIRLYMIRKKCEEPIRLAFGKNGIILRILDVRSLPVRSSHCKWREDGPISDDQEQGWVYTHKHIKYYFCYILCILCLFVYTPTSTTTRYLLQHIFHKIDKLHLTERCIEIHSKSNTIK